MSWFYEDPDEWEADVQSGTWGKYPGTDMNFGWLSVGRKRRPPEEVARIKAERQRLHEEAVLREADAIRARRALESGAST